MTNGEGGSYKDIGELDDKWGGGGGTGRSRLRVIYLASRKLLSTTFLICISHFNKNTIIKK